MVSRFSFPRCALPLSVIFTLAIRQWGRCRSLTCDYPFWRKAVVHTQSAFREWERMSGNGGGRLLRRFFARVGTRPVVGNHAPGGRPQNELQLGVLIRRISVEKPFWGAPVSTANCSSSGSSVAKYMVKRPGPPSQGWQTFLRKHAPDIAAMELFVVPTIGFDLIVRLDRRDLVWIVFVANTVEQDRLSSRTFGRAASECGRNLSINKNG